MNRNQLSIRNLIIAFAEDTRELQVIRGMNADFRRGEITGILGESGSGKTVSMTSIAGLISQTAVSDGSAVFRETDLIGLDARGLQAVRGSGLAYIFQNPGQALSPNSSIGRQFRRLLRYHKREMDESVIRAALEEAGLAEPDIILDMYPFQLSGGQNQRVAIALAILLKPELIIADEPTSSIDSNLRRRILDLLLKINRELGTSIIIITHDFDVVNYLCNRILVMYAGLIMEAGPRGDILEQPLHPYTAELIRCSTSLRSGDERLHSLPGGPLSPAEFSDACPFHPRCAFAMDQCLDGIPEAIETDGRMVRCKKNVISKMKSGARRRRRRSDTDYHRRRRLDAGDHLPDASDRHSDAAGDPGGSTPDRGQS